MLSADLFIWTAPALFAAAPITDLHLHGGFSDVKAALASPYLCRLRSVRFSGDWEGNEFVRRLGKCRDLGSIRELTLSHCRLTDFGARDLARIRVLGNLTVLRVQWNRLTEDGIDALATAPGLAGLTCLDVTGNYGARQDGWTDLRARYGPRLVF
jgi:hypothetical protein